MTEQLPPNASHPEHEIPPGLSRWDRAFLQIENGVARAEKHQTEIDDLTAEAIAEFLAEAAGPGSALELFQPQRRGQYEALRDEYLAIYNHHETPPEVRRWIDWFGTYLVMNELGDRRDQAVHSLPEHPRLDRLLVPTEFPLTQHPPLQLHVPAHFTGAELQRINEHLDTLDLAAWPAFRAFLRLPHIHAGLVSLEKTFFSRFVGAYENRAELLSQLGEFRRLERAVARWARAQELPPEVFRIDHTALEAWLHHEYAVIQYEGKFYAFR